MSESETSIDYISLLPDSILHYILSFLPQGDFIKTSVLSKRWLSVWAEVPVLRFADGSDESIPGFVTFVTKTLANYRGSNLKKLDLTVNYECSFSSQVDEWIRVATERKVEDLFLSLLSRSLNPSQSYELPQSIYSNSSLQVLNTRCCNFKPSVSVSWTSLQKLSICYAKLSDDSLASILLGSPNLQSLKLMIMLAGLDKISAFSNKKLKEIVLHCWLKSEPTLEISAPHLHSLSLIGTTHARKIKLLDLSSLMELNLNLSGAGYESLTGLVDELHRVEKLRVNSVFLQFLSTCQTQMLAFPFPLKCTSLIVDSSIKEWDFQRIVTLLQATPHLSQLKIVMDHSNRYELQFDDKSEYWESLGTDVNCGRLTTVFITGFEENWCVGIRLKFFTSIVEFLLKSATVLEKMVIYAQPERTAQSVDTIETNKRYKLPDLSEVNKLISSYPRASTVLFKTYLD